MTQGAAKYGRVLLKLSGEALLGDRKFGISPQYVKYLAEEIRKVQQLPAEVAIVIGGGNFMRGAAVAEHGIDRATADYMGMLAMVINALALQSGLEQKDVPARDPAPREGARRDLRSRYRQSVLHERHRGGAPGRRDQRGRDPDGKELGG